MKNLILFILLIVLIVLFGTWPLSIVGNVFEVIGGLLKKIANILNFFGWNGLAR